ncbi:hypothetical protein ABPG75_012797 [Micractinium tetrahymenae]
MPGASQQQQRRWADLPQELLQLTASKLGAQDRSALLDVCSSWAAAMEAAPHLLPTAVLHGPCLATEMVANRRWKEDRQLHPLEALQALLMDRQHAERQLDAAARLSPRQRRVTLRGFKGQVRLRSLRITGDGSRVDWGGQGAAVVLPKLEELSLDCRQERKINPFGTEDTVGILQLPLGAAMHLQTATRLHSLALRAKWCDVVPALLAALPALRQLRLDLYECTHKHAQAAVAALSQLPARVLFALGAHAYWGHEEDFNYPELEEYPWLSLPPMSHLRGLTHLCLAGAVSLPPDWRQLPSLHHLMLSNDSYWAEEGNWQGGLFEWGAGPLTALTALSRLDIRGVGDIDAPGPIHGALPDAAQLATAPALARVHADRAPAGWPAQLRALRPDLELTR